MLQTVSEPRKEDFRAARTRDFEVVVVCQAIGYVVNTVDALIKEAPLEYTRTPVGAVQSIGIYLPKDTRNLLDIAVPRLGIDMYIHQCNQQQSQPAKLLTCMLDCASP
jgi:hypothetical protein